ncbi:MAG: O-antigen ligase family protein [Candidatus Magasanikbacteria bacterium]|nr:O-antigen ligase family protein [Candidatus Magasanikbacteria bacterium]
MKSPNFLDFLYKKGKVNFFAVFLVFILLFIPFTLLLVFSPIVVVAIVASVLIGLFVVRLDIGIYLLAFFAFFQGWSINFSQYHWVDSFPFLNQLNAPVVDFLALFLLFSFLVAWSFKIIKLKGRKIKDKFPGILWYGGFILTSLISIFFIYNNFFSIGIKYLVRPMVFVYLAFVFLPYQLIHSRKLIYKILNIWVFVGFLISLFGLSSLFMVDTAEWIRVVPYAFGGFAPLGFNHNLLAEPLVVIFPIAVFFYLVDKSKSKKFLLGIVSFLMLITIMLTLSRAAWISLGVELLVLAWFTKDRLVSKKALLLKTLTILVLGITVAYMGVFLFKSSIVESSTTARAEATNVAIFYTFRSPWVGYGPGMFQYVLADTKILVFEYGSPLDSHGFLQKILLEEGFVGLFFFLGFLSWVLWTLWQSQKRTHFSRKRKLLYQVLFVSVLGIIIFELFNTSYFNAVMWMPIGIALASTSKLSKIE